LGEDSTYAGEESRNIFAIGGHFDAQITVINGQFNVEAQKMCKWITLFNLSEFRL
jgi:hypothetical protein